MCPCSRHGAVSVDANPLPSSDRSTTAVQASDSQQCSVVVINEHHSHDPAASESLRDSQVPCTNKTGPATLVTSSTRPICPNLPYSPSCSPRFARRRPPLRECRVSVNVQSLDDPNAYQKLNQYKLIDSIGQVYIYYIIYIFGPGNKGFKSIFYSFLYDSETRKTSKF